MASGASIQGKVAKVLARVNATSREVSFRTVSTTGGNALLGLGTTVSSSDTVCDPQPAVDVLRTDEIANSGGFLQMGDYKLLFAGSVEEATLTSSMILYGSEVLKIVQYVPVPIDGTVVAWEVIARAVKP
jgi:hypothetical protein